MPEPEPRDDLIRTVMQAHLHCASCGYDVTGARGMCPECGQHIDENDPETVTVGPKGPESKKIEQAATTLLRWLVIGFGIIFALAFLSGLAMLISRTERIFPP